MEEKILKKSRKEKKHKSSSSNEQYLDLNGTTSEDSPVTKIKKKKNREKNHDFERQAEEDSSIENKKKHKHLEIESSSDDINSRKKKKLKTEPYVDYNDQHHDSYASDLPDERHKKKKKKKHKEIETSESSSNIGVYNGIETIKVKNEKVDIESKVEPDYDMEDYDNQNSYINYESDNQSIKHKKKKMKKEKIDEPDVYSNGDIGNTILENQSHYTNSQLLDINYSTDSVDANTKKKKKKKHKDVEPENILPDDRSKLKTEGKEKAEAKSEVTDFDSKVIHKIKSESSVCSSPESHVKKAKKKSKYSKYDEENYYSNDSTVELKKMKKEETKDESIIEVEISKKSKKDKHKIEMKKEPLETDYLLETQHYTQESDDLESSQKVKSKKKKHKKQEKDVEEEEKNTEFIEPQLKKKKMKKHSEELLQEEPSSVYINEDHVDDHNHKKKKKKHSEKSNPDLDHEAYNQDNVKEDHIDDHNHKKKKKKHKKEETEDETDCNSQKKRYEQMEKVLQATSSIKHKRDEECNRSSGFESEEGDYSESERMPRLSKSKPSIFTKYPKLARILQDSDSDDNHPQHRKLTLEEALKLSELKIQLRHEPPPQHQVEKYPGTSTLTPEEKKKFQEYCELKKGRFTHEEDQRIVHNWKKFCKTHDWKRSVIYPFLHPTRKGFFYVASLEGRKHFVQFLAKGLPHRSLYSVYTRFRNLYATHKTIRYTKEEDEIIMKEVKDANGRNKFSAVGRKLNRTRASVWRRYKILIQKKKENSDNEENEDNENVEKRKAINKSITE